MGSLLPTVVWLKTVGEVLVTEMAMDENVSASIGEAVRRAKDWPELQDQAEALARSDQTLGAVQTVVDMVAQERLRPENRRAATVAAGEAVALAAMTRKAHGRRAMDREEISSILEFIKHLFNGTWE